MKTRAICIYSGVDNRMIMNPRDPGPQTHPHMSPRVSATCHVSVEYSQYWHNASVRPLIGSPDLVSASDWLLDMWPMLTVLLTSGEQADDLFPSQVVGDDIHLEVPARHALRCLGWLCRWVEILLSMILRHPLTIWSWYSWPPLVTDIIVEISFADMKLPEVPRTGPGTPLTAGASRAFETCSRNAEERLGSEIVWNCRSEGWNVVLSQDYSFTWP